MFQSELYENEFEIKLIAEAHVSWIVKSNSQVFLYYSKKLLDDHSLIVN